jgi:hypothetical protein
MGLSTLFLRRVRLATTGVAVIVGAGCQEAPTSPTSSPRPELVKQHSDQPSVVTPSYLVDVSRFFAPVFKQYHQKYWAYDLMTKVTFDGDWLGINNWENTDFTPKPAYVYASIIEDVNRYFIHYGTFHPRDHCLGGGGLTSPLECDGDFVLPGSWGADHENDMEGLTVVVDKRFVTASWPFGQIITAQTIYHHDYQLYKNCSLEGWPAYVTEVPGQDVPFKGCVVFRSGPPGWTTPSPSKRIEAMIDFGGHAVWMSSSPPQLHMGEGVFEYAVTDGSPGIPQLTIDFWWHNYSWDSLGYQHDDSIPHYAPIPPTAYALQFITDPELAGSALSLWDQRFTVSGGPFSGTDQEFVNPPGVSMFTHFRGDNGHDNSPKVPWGQSGGSGNQLGIWHNHPSWYWRTYWAPSGPYASQYYEYCRLSSCQSNHDYSFNPYLPPPPPPPPPALTIGLTGPSLVRTSVMCLWIATPSNGVGPYTYSWYINSSPVNNNSSLPEELIHQNAGSAFTVSVTVHDAAGAIGSNSKAVTISASAAQCPY